MDLTFSVPKSVSLAWAVGNDEQVIELLRAAVHETMAEDIEPLVARRVRSGKHAATRARETTGKLIYADFLHKTSRPVDGAPDPHLHIHAFVMNWTEQGGKHYAAELEEIVRQRASLQAKFDARLARKLEAAGYRVESVRYLQSGRQKRGWELVGVSRDTIEEFSRRTAEIEDYAKNHGITDAEEKGRVAKLTREKKQESQSIAELRRKWRGRLTDNEREGFQRLKTQATHRQVQSETERAVLSVEHALRHHLERNSTVERHQLIGTALEHGLTLKVKHVEQAIEKLGLIQRTINSENGQRHYLTTRSVLQAERQMIAFARDGRGVKKAIRTDEHQFSREWLNDHQKGAVRQVVKSRDAVIAVLGGAGTGKTSLMQEAAEAIRQGGKQVLTVAPTTGAREVLQQKGFKDAQTVEHLVKNSKLQDQLKGNVLWIDEAGLVDVRTMNKVFKIANEQNARVVLSGDTRQHASPSRGDALRLLERDAGLRIARSEQILRQQGRYRDAVAFISKGHTVVDHRTGKTGLEAGFDLLDAMGKIKELGAGERHEQLAAAYVNALDRGKTSLVVSPTHAEARLATDEIRNRLKQRGVLGTEEQTITQYRSLNLTAAERGTAQTYANPEGMVVQFHQNAHGGIRRGERYRVVGMEAGQVQLASMSGASPRTLPLEAADKFEVYAEQQLSIAAGDKVRFSLGGTTKDSKKRIANGRLDEVKGFDRQGNLVLKNGWVVDKQYAHLDLGYVVTSHASQGKDRQVAIAAMGAESLPAINAKQFYVTVSRGSEDVLLFVDDKSRVRRAIQRSGERLSASELVATKSQSRGTARTRGQSQRHDRRANFRDRLVSWWRGLREQRGVGAPPLGNGLAGIAREFGIGLTPSPGRSRG